MDELKLINYLKKWKESVLSKEQSTVENSGGVWRTQGTDEPRVAEVRHELESGER